MSFKLPNDEELRKLFSELDANDLADLSSQFDDDVSQARMNQLRAIADMGDAELTMTIDSNVDSSDLTMGRDDVSFGFSIPSYRTETFDSTGAIETNSNRVLKAHNEMGVSKIYTKAA